jgi:hypothetical protein
MLVLGKKNLNLILKLKAADQNLCPGQLSYFGVKKNCTVLIAHFRVQFENDQ